MYPVGNNHLLATKMRKKHLYGRKILSTTPLIDYKDMDLPLSGLAPDLYKYRDYVPTRPLFLTCVSVVVHTHDPLNRAELDVLCPLIDEKMEVDVIGPAIEEKLQSDQGIHSDGTTSSNGSTWTEGNGRILVEFFNVSFDLSCDGIN